MPLNISIDVDGTLLEASEQPASDIREHLQRLKSQGHHLQLWSTGGADYALRKAKEQGLADLFESFATKPDAAIDDIPESVRPFATLKVDDKFLLAHAIKLLESEVEDCIESACCPSPELTAYVAKIQREEAHIRTTYGQILRPGIPLHPIPFFGNLQSARIVTVGLNPSSSEFEKWRQWPETIGASDLALRLVTYFRRSYPMPHPWFADMQEALSIVNCPYSLCAAHVDASPWTSYSPTTLNRRDTTGQLVETYNAMLHADVSHLSSVLSFSGHLKLVIVIGKRPWMNFVCDAINQQFNGRVEVIEKSKLAGWFAENKVELSALIGIPSHLL